MPPRTRAELAVDFADNVTNDITPARARGLVDSVALLTEIGGKYLGQASGVAQASLPLIGLIGAAFDEYVLRWAGLMPGTNNTPVGVQLSTDNGASWIATGYEYGVRLQGVSTSFETYSRAGSQAIALIGTTGLSSTIPSFGITHLFRANTSEAKVFITDAVCGNGGDGNVYGVSARSRYPTATPFNALRLVPTVGTISGVVRLYGINK